MRVIHFHRQGVYHGAAMSESARDRGKDISIADGAKSAGRGARFLSCYARKVPRIVRAAELQPTMSRDLADRIRRVANVEVTTWAEVCGVAAAVGEGSTAIHAVPRHRRTA